MVSSFLSSVLLNCTVEHHSIALIIKLSTYTVPYFNYPDRSSLVWLLWWLINSVSTYLFACVHNNLHDLLKCKYDHITLYTSKASQPLQTAPTVMHRSQGLESSGPSSTIALPLFLPFPTFSVTRICQISSHLGLFTHAFFSVLQCLLHLFIQADFSQCSLSVTFFSLAFPDPVGQTISLLLFCIAAYTVRVAVFSNDLFKSWLIS